MFPPRATYTVPLAHGGSGALGQRPLVMGILNITPDSFAEAARLDAAGAVDRALQMQEEGADIVDVGGESTRPGATPVPAADERARVMPVIRALAGRLRVPLSIDTYKSSIAREALAEGAALVNDVSGLLYDPGLGSVVADAEAGLVLMHMRGRSAAMYAEAEYGDLMADLAAELGQAIDRATSAGVPRTSLILDPGIGFAKQQAHSYGVLARLHELADRLDRPLLAGPSRKSFMASAIGPRPAAERDWGTAAAVTAAVLGGAHIVRVHAVAQMVQVVRVAEEIRRHA